MDSSIDSILSLCYPKFQIIFFRFFDSVNCSNDFIMRVDQVIPLTGIFTGRFNPYYIHVFFHCQLNAFLISLNGFAGIVFWKVHRTHKYVALGQPARYVPLLFASLF